ncbi:MAG TPA: ribosome silencing factor [Candidatus Latescibacteria bacterium]|nr:ribosome silencing factor [Candidatus Latescibacterota bacterium]
MIQKKARSRRKPARDAAPVPETVGVLVEAVRSKKASNVVVMDLRGLTDVADFFVLCTADVDVHARAILDAVREALVPFGRDPWHVEGEESLNWVLVDFVDTVVHIFREDARQFYGLEEMWADAPRVPFPDVPPRVGEILHAGSLPPADNPRS